MKTNSKMLLCGNFIKSCLLSFKKLEKQVYV